MKRLSFRFCRRALLILAILFPIVYLCGGLFLGLAGAHGEQMFAEPVYTEEYVEVADISTEGSYRFELNSVEDALTEVFTRFEFNYTFMNYNQTAFAFFRNNNILYFSSLGESPIDLATYNQTTSVYSEFSKPWVFYSDEKCKSLLDYLKSKGCTYSVEKLLLVPTDYVAENNSAYTDFIFSQPFAKDNFISKLGRGVLDDTAFGFPPFRDMFNWFNDSVMHIESDDDLGVFGLGYAYYAMNVVAVYELVVLVLMVFALPLRITDKFMGEHL